MSSVQSVLYMCLNKWTRELLAMLFISVSLDLHCFVWQNLMKGGSLKLKNTIITK